MALHHMKRKEAVKKYGHLKGDELTSALLDDENKYTEEDIAEITKAINSPSGTPQRQDKALLTQPGKKAGLTTDQVKEAQDNHPHYKWYDEFESRIHKKEVLNIYTNQTHTISIGWELNKKLHPKFIEPEIAKSMNSFANGAEPSGIFKFLVLKGTKSSGDFIHYKEWAEEQGIDLKKDINILLNN